MRIGAVLVSLLVGTTVSTGAPRMNAADIAQIEQLQKEFMTHWSAGDAAGCASVFVEDGKRVGARGDVQHGRAEIEQAYAKLFSGPFQGAKVTGGPATVRPLGHDYALCEAAFTIIPAQGEPLEGYSVDVMQKSRGRWWVLESHPKLFPPQLRKS